jgi:hypothetical protein
VDVLDVAARLYALTPDEFTQARNDASAEAKAAGDAAAAASIKQLRKPSSSAWLVNVLTRHAGGEVDELVDVGGALRAAQDAQDGEQLRALTRERRELVGRLTASAIRLGREAGHRAGDAITREVSATLDAVVIDAGAAAAVRSGRLVKALIATGFEPVALDDAVACPDELPDVAPSGRPRLRSVKPASGRTADPPAQPAVDEARERLANTERALVRAESAVQSADAEITTAETNVTRAESALHEARQALRTAKSRHIETARERDTADRKRNAARQDLQRREGS